MENYERPQEYYDTKEEIELWKEDDWWIISHKGMNVTTQGKTRLEALLMLADAISGYKNSDEDLVEMSQEVFIPDEDMIEFMDEMTDNQISNPASGAQLTCFSFFILDGIVVFFICGYIFQFLPSETAIIEPCTPLSNMYFY